jgi:hypothetical protein
MICGFIWPKSQLGSFGQNAFRPSSSRPSAARAGTHEHQPVIMGGDDRIEKDWVRFAKCAAHPRPHPSRRRFAPPQDGASKAPPRAPRWLVRSLYFPVFFRFGTVSVRGNPGSAVHRFALHRVRTRDSNGRIPHYGFTCQTAQLVPAPAFLRPGFASLLHSPQRGVGGAPRDVRVLGGTPVGVHVTRHARRLARRLASHDAGRSPLGAPPWRFWAGGRASVSGITPDPCSELLAARS